MRTENGRFRRMGILALGLFALLAAGGTRCAGQDQAPKVKSKLKKPKAAQAETYVLVGAGDIAGCSSIEGAKATAKLIEHIPGAVFAAGDLAYEKGTDAEFRDCYNPTWGKFKNRTYPVPGNHEYNGTEGTGYFHYWGDRAGEASKGYYSFDLGGWHIIALNTVCNSKALGGCGKGSPQEMWLAQDLAEHPNACIVAFGHHALYSSGLVASHANHPELKDIWTDLYNAHADVVLAGHEHSYERFAPQDPDAHDDPKNGIREIVVGTGGRSHTPLGAPVANSEVRNSDTYGVLKLTLEPGKYKWEFVPERGKTFTDSGTGICHNAPPKNQ